MFVPICAAAAGTSFFWKDERIPDYVRVVGYWSAPCFFVLRVFFDLIHVQTRLSMCLREKKPTNAGWNSRQTAVPGCPQGSSVIVQEMSSQRGACRKTGLSPRGNSIRGPHSTTLLTSKSILRKPSTLVGAIRSILPPAFLFFLPWFQWSEATFAAVHPWIWMPLALVAQSYSPLQGDPVVGGIKPSPHRSVRFEMSRSNEEDFLF